MSTGTVIGYHFLAEIVTSKHYETNRTTVKKIFLVRDKIRSYTNSSNEDKYVCIDEDDNVHIVDPRNFLKIVRGFDDYKESEDPEETLS